MADGRHIENRFWPYLGAVLADQREIRNRNEGSHADIGHITNTVIFENSRWRTADDRHFENSIISISQPRIIRFRSNLVHRYKFPFPACKFDKKIDFFPNSRWRTDAILKTVFGYLSEPYWPIYANFGMGMKHHMQISVT